MTPVLNAGHPLLTGITAAWLPQLAGGRGQFVPAFGPRSQPGKLVGNPTWRETRAGPGIQTGNLKYVDLRPLSWFTGTFFVSYLYRWDNGASEDGCLYSDGANGHELRHQGVNVQLIKANVILLTGATVATPERDALCTAAITIDHGVTANMRVWYNGRLAASTLSGQDMATGTTTSALGYQFSGAPVFGQHTILGALFYKNHVLSAPAIWELDQAARQQFRPLFLTSLQTLGTEGPAAVTDWLPVSRSPRPAVVPPPPPPTERRTLTVTALAESPVSAADWQPRPYSRVVLPVAEPAPRADRRMYPGPLPAFPSPPNPQLRAKAKPFVPPNPFGDASRDVQITHKISELLNSLVRRGELVRLDNGVWTLRPGARTVARDPTSFDDARTGIITGAVWVNTVSKTGFMCVDNTANAAVWKQITS